jgi:ketosteroid isomerase-like protein
MVDGECPLKTPTGPAENRLPQLLASSAPWALSAAYWAVASSSRRASSNHHTPMLRHFSALRYPAGFSDGASRKREILGGAMSQENVEIVRRTTDAYNAGDREASFDFIAKDVEIYPDARFAEGKPFRGREEFKRFLADLDQGWEGGGTGVIKEVFPVGDDRVVARGEWGGKGRASGIDLRSSLTAIYTIEDGKIIKIEYFFDHADALEAAGLRE